MSIKKVTKHEIGDPKLGLGLSSWIYWIWAQAWLIYLESRTRQRFRISTLPTRAQTSWPGCPTSPRSCSTRREILPESPWSLPADRSHGFAGCKGCHGGRDDQCRYGCQRTETEIEETMNYYFLKMACSGLFLFIFVFFAHKFYRKKL